MSSPPRVRPRDLDRRAAAWADRAVRAYQRWLSPLKGPGRACAHRLAHGGDSCSQHARYLLARHGLRRSVPLILDRFGNCQRAARRLAALPALAAVPLPPYRRRHRGQCCIVIPMPACGTARTIRMWQPLDLRFVVALRQVPVVGRPGRCARGSTPELYAAALLSPAPRR